MFMLDFKVHTFSINYKICPHDPKYTTSISVSADFDFNLHNGC